MAEPPLSGAVQVSFTRVWLAVAVGFSGAAGTVAVGVPVASAEGVPSPLAL